MNLGDYSGWWARMRGDKPAAVFGDQTLTWAELDARANGLAAALQDMGVERGDRVGCLLPNCMEWLASYVAVLKAGAILVPLNPGYGDSELREIEAQAECRAVVSSARLMRKLAPELGANAADEAPRLYTRRRAKSDAILLSDAMASGAMPTDVRVAPDDVAVLSYTSGSTGLPKGVMLTHQGIHAVTTSVILEHRWTSEEQVLLLAPLAFTGGVIVVATTAYLSGACLHIEPAFDPARALQLIVQRRITSVTAVPILFERLSMVPGFASADISSLRLAISGGAPVSENLLKLYRDKGVCLRQTYGCTEGCGYLSIPTETDAWRKPWSCGSPLPTVQIRIVDEAGAICATDRSGEIQLRGVQVMKGYWRNPDADRAAWSDDWNGRWYSTGDIGSFDEAGHLRVLDRKKSMIISGGVNVYPAEVEREIGRIAGVAEGLCFGRPDPVWGERVVVAVFATQPLDPETLLAECRERLGAYKAPRELILSRKPLPRTSTGKLPRHRLDEIYAALADEPRAAAQS